MQKQKITNIADFKRGMTFELTQADIDEGIAVNCLKCPIALCLSRHIKGQIRVGNRSIMFNSYYINTSKQLRTWIKDFDAFWLKHKKKVGNPITIILDIWELAEGQTEWVFDIKRKGD